MLWAERELGVGFLPKTKILKCLGVMNFELQKCEIKLWAKFVNHLMFLTIYVVGKITV